MQASYVNSHKGFTLIELVVVILIMSTIGIMTASYVRNSMDIYTHITTLDKSLDNVRFVMERLRREVGNALPNSISVKGRCLTFTPIFDDSIYGNDFPINPRMARQGTIAPISSDIKGSKAVVYALTPDEALVTSNKSYLVHSYNRANNKIQFADNVSFQASSPEKRIYFIKDKTTYCFNDMNLYRQINDQEKVLMGENMTGNFFTNETKLTSHSLLQVQYISHFDGQEVAFEQTLHINNKP